MNKPCLHNVRPESACRICFPRRSEQLKEARRTRKLGHSHLCPICHTAFNCYGVRCAGTNGVPHPDCAPTNAYAKKHVVLEQGSKTVKVCQKTLEQVILDHFPTRLDQYWGHDVWGMDWDDNTVAATVRFVKTGKAEDYVGKAQAEAPQLDIYSIRVHCTFGKVEVSKNGPPGGKEYHPRPASTLTGQLTADELKGKQT